MEIAMESQELKELLFSIVYRETSNKNIEKMQNTLFLNLSCSNLGKNEYFTRIGLRHC